MNTVIITVRHVDTAKQSLVGHEYGHLNHQTCHMNSLSAIGRMNTVTVTVRHVGMASDNNGLNMSMATYTITHLR